MRSDTSGVIGRTLELIDEAIDAGGSPPSLARLSVEVGMAPSKLREAFLIEVGITPRAYAEARRAERLRDDLAAGTTVAEAIHGAGYGSVSRVYERHDDLLGMTPAKYRRGAPGELVRYSYADSSLGRVIVAATDAGVCFIAFGDDDDSLLAELAARFARAEIAPAVAEDVSLVSQVISLIDAPSHSAELPLDVRGTAFQQQVWAALTRIEPGDTVTYAELARAIGKPTAVRAVAQACGANPLAVAVPCHRVIGSDGSLTGYRWGTERKRALLKAEEHA